MPTAVAKALLNFIGRDISQAGKHSVAWFESKVDLVLAAAEDSTIRYMKKLSLGLLDGVSTGVKDDLDLDGYKTTLDSLNDYSLEDASTQSVTSLCVRKLEESSAVILGNLAMHEFGLGISVRCPFPTTYS